MNLILRHSRGLFGQDVRLSSAILAGTSLFFAIVRLQPSVVSRHIGIRTINGLIVGIKLAFADLTVGALAVVLDDTPLVDVLVNVDIFHQHIVVKIFSHILLLKFSLLD